MAYASWSVVFGEQPSASKWNILGTNDASFNNGTGIANLALSTTTVSNPYKFRAYRNAAWTSGNGADAKVQFDTENFDTNSNYDSVTNYRYTAPVNGFYWFNTRAGASVTSGNYMILSFYKNGALVAGGPALVSAATVDQGISASCFLQLVATDYVEVYFRGTGAAGDTGSTATFFSGFLVSQT